MSQSTPHTNPLVKIVSRWTMPLAANQEERFCERNIRVIILLGATIFTILMIFSFLTDSETITWGWYILIFTVLAGSFFALHKHNILLAGYILSLASVSILFDPAAAYWSPGTVLLSIMFSYLTLLILPITRGIIVPITLNIGIYIFITFTAQSASPLTFMDYYSDPFLAIVATLLSHVTVIGIGLYIRKDQAERDKIALQAEQERVAFLQRIFHNLSHDLKTPVSNIRLSSELMERLATDQQTRVLQRLGTSVDKLEKIVEDFLQMSELDAEASFKPELLDLQFILNEIYEEFVALATEKSQTLVHDQSTIPLMVMAQRVYLQRAISNILRNAIMFTPEKGTISMTVAINKQTLILEIRDTGIGISEDTQQYIFDYFYRGDESRNSTSGNSGLGLSISKRIIELHSGTIEVESELEKGTLIRIHLPLSDQPTPVRAAQ